jgi:hypothetical protein
VDKDYFEKQWVFSDAKPPEELEGVVNRLKKMGKNPTYLLYKGDSMLSAGQFVLVMSYEDYEALERESNQGGA